METETSARWALFIFTLSSNRAKENISTRDGKRSGGKGIRPLEMTNSTGRLVKSWAVHSAAFTFTRQSPESKTNIPVRLSVSRLFSLNVPFCCGCLPLPVIQRSCHTGPAVPPSADIPLFPPRFPLILRRPVSVGPAGHIKMPPTPHCPGGVRVQLSSYETIWNTHHGGGVVLGMVYM